MPSHSGSLCFREVYSASDFSPSQQLALVTLRDRDPLAQAVARTLRSSTVRAGADDYRTLRDLKLAEWDDAFQHRLTNLGTLIAGIVARELARDFEVAIEAPLRRRRSAFSPSLLSQSGNW